MFAIIIIGLIGMVVTIWKVGPYIARKWLSCLIVAMGLLLLYGLNPPFPMTTVPQISTRDFLDVWLRLGLVGVPVIAFIWFCGHNLSAIFGFDR